jgi:hypothetical protein
MSVPDECISETSRANLIGCQQFQQNQQNEQSLFFSFSYYIHKEKVEHPDYPMVSSNVFPYIESLISWH